MAKKKLPEDIAKYFQREGARGGRTAAANMTPAARKRRARAGALAKAKAAKKGGAR